MLACEPKREAMLMCYSAIVIVLWLTLFPMFHTFLEADRKHKISRIIFWFTILELILSLVALPLGLAFGFAYHHHIYCHRMSEDIYAKILSGILAVGAIQTFVMLIIWFIRLYISFRSSAFHLTKCTMGIYVTLFILLGIDLIFLFIAAAPAIRTNNWTLFMALLNLFSFVNILIAVSISVLFAIKLRKVCVGQYDEPFINTINKMFICTTLSLLVTIISSITVAFALPNGQNSIISTFLGCFMITMEHYSNCLFVMLSFQGFTKYYCILLGWIHRSLNSYWRKKIALKEAIDSNIEITSTTGGHDST
eukprot:78261_1